MFRTLLPGLIVTALVPLQVTRVVANEPASVSRTPPTAYETMVKPHLTKLEDARALPKVATGQKDPSTESVLEELIGYVEDSGKALLVSG